ncbi:hypothetical protein SLEP1_g14959 [Rubroshorea leprosula]|uniref:Uncharacterized protein n=1 Tax=Rubroshorea leprosula TaxID=152421 RepID=A0AAV5IKT6_9ROSI|nr:hypothetical protein SLEP1_g14959 [Rubroshorea leprosula]
MVSFGNFSTVLKHNALFLDCLLTVSRLFLHRPLAFGLRVDGPWDCQLLDTWLSVFSGQGSGKRKRDFSVLPPIPVLFEPEPMDVYIDPVAFGFFLG